MDQQDVQALVRQELEQIRFVLEDLTGLKSRWNGNVLLMSSAEMRFVKGREALAEKQWGCDILLNTALIEEPIRWRTYLHELLHSVSVGLTEADYRRFRGWEESVVEALQRELRQEVLLRMGVSVPEDLFVGVESVWPFNGYIEALETLRNVVGQETLPFYLQLLQTPLANRLSAMYALREDAAYRRLFALASGKLR